MPIVEDDYAKYLVLVGFTVAIAQALIELDNMVHYKMDLPSDLISNLIGAQEFAKKEIKVLKNKNT